MTQPAAKPTPGPWALKKAVKAGLKAENDHLIYQPSDGRHIAETFQYQDHGVPDGPAEANARLIVAACNAAMAINPDNPIAAAEAMPDVIETLDWIAKEPSGVYTRDIREYFKNVIDAIQTKAQEVLAKATGEKIGNE